MPYQICNGAVQFAAQTVLAAGMLVFMGGLIVTGQRGGGFMIGSTPVLKAEEEAELEGISEITISSGADDIRFLESPTEKMIIKQYRAGRSDDFEPYVITKKGTELKIYNDWKQKVFSFHFFGGDWDMWRSICLQDIRNRN